MKTKLKKSIVQMLGVLMVLTIIFTPPFELVKSKFVVTQTVTKNEVDVEKYQNYIQSEMYRGISYFSIPMYDLPDSVIKKQEAAREVERKAAEAKRYEEEKEYNRPYKLVTIFKGISLTDYGTFKEIDSLRCLRVKEIKRTVFVRDSTEKAKEMIAERDLELLNKKCND